MSLPVGGSILEPSGCIEWVIFDTGAIGCIEWVNAGAVVVLLQRICCGQALGKEYQREMQAMIGRFNCR